MNGPLWQQLAPGSGDVSQDQVNTLLQEWVAAHSFKGKKILAIIPDGTRTAPIGQIFRSFHGALSGVAAKIDIMIALGTHPPMSEEAILKRLEWSPEER